MATKQDELIALVEDALAANVAMGSAHHFIALRGRNLPPELINEFQHDEQKRREQQSILQRVRQLVGKRAGRDQE